MPATTLQQVTHASARTAAGALLAMTFVWGTTFVVVQFAIAAMPVASFLMWRFAIAAVVLLLVRPGSVAAMPAELRTRGVVAGLVLGLGYLLQTVGLHTTPASVSGFITGMFVVFTPLVSAVVLRQRVSPVAWLAVVIATLGLGLLALAGWSIGTGELLTLVAALVYAVHIVLLGRWSSREHAYGLTVVQLGTVALLFTVLAVVEGGGTVAVPPGADVWAAIVFMAVLATALAFAAQTWAQSQLTTTRTAVIMTTEPVWAGLTGVLVAGDAVTARFLLGAALVLLAMYLVELAPRHPGEAAGPDLSLPHLEP